MVQKVNESQVSDIVVDAEMDSPGGTLSVNLSVLPLVNTQEEKLGTMLAYPVITHTHYM